MEIRHCTENVPTILLYKKIFICKALTLIQINTIQNVCTWLKLGHKIYFIYKKKTNAQKKSNQNWNV